MAMGIRLVSPDWAFSATNRALLPKADMPSGMTASCLEFRAPCMNPLKMELVPRVTIMAFRLKKEMSAPFTAPSSAPNSSTNRMGSHMPPW